MGNAAPVPGAGFSASRALAVGGLVLACCMAILAPQGLTWLPLVQTGLFLLIRGAGSGAADVGRRLAERRLLLASAGLFLLLAAAGVARSAEPVQHALTFAAFLLALCASAAGVLAAARVGSAGRWHWLYFPAVLTGLGLATAAAVTHASMLTVFGERLLQEWAYNRAAVLCALLLPLAAFAVSRSGADKPLRAAALAAAGVACLAAVTVSHSASAKLALVVVGLTMLGARLSLRTAAAASAACVIILLALAPFAPPVVLDATRGWSVWQNEANSFLERMLIWSATSAEIRDGFLFGYGLEHARDAGVLFSDTGERRFHNHPHSFLLQVWLDLGLAGAVLLAAALLAAYRLVARLPSASGAMMLAMLNGMLAVWAVSHGMWQSWYVGLCGLVLMFGALAHHRSQAEESARLHEPRERSAGKLDNAGRASL
jgi:O-antigen ligase